MAERGRPVHLAILVGVSAGAYAAALAGVAGLQSGADQALVAERAPVALHARVVAQTHDRLEAAVGDVADRLQTHASAYEDLSPVIVGLESALDDVARRADAITKSARSLPTRISLPSVPVMSVSRPAPRPAVHAWTRASG